jgi:hypothetical protein
MNPIIGSKIIIAQCFLEQHGSTSPVRPGLSGLDCAEGTTKLQIDIYYSDVICIGKECTYRIPLILTSLACLTASFDTFPSRTTDASLKVVILNLLPSPVAAAFTVKKLMSTVSSAVLHWAAAVSGVGCKDGSFALAIELRREERE